MDMWCICLNSLFHTIFLLTDFFFLLFFFFWWGQHACFRLSNKDNLIKYKLPFLNDDFNKWKVCPNQRGFVWRVFWTPWVGRWGTFNVLFYLFVNDWIYSFHFVFLNYFSILQAWQKRHWTSSLKKKNHGFQKRALTFFFPPIFY